MKIKNLNFAEKYIEKVVLGAAILFSLAVIWVKVLGSPYAVEFSGQVINPSEIEPKIAEEANRLKRELEKPVSFEVPAIPKITEEFIAKLNKPVATYWPKLAVGPVHLPSKWFGDGTGGPGGIDRFLLPTPPPPSGLQLAQGFGVMGEPRQADELQKFERLIGAQRPWDFRWVSVSGKYDMAHWRERLAIKPVERGFQKIPEEWWREMLALADVSLERQEWDPESRQWGPEVTIDALPNNTLSYRNPPMAWAPADAKQIVGWIKENQRDITKPRFPSLAVGFWLRPDVDINNLPQAKLHEFIKLRERIEDLQREIGKRADEEAAGVAGGAAAGMAGAPSVPGAMTAAPATNVRGRVAAGEEKTPQKMPLKDIKEQLRRLEIQQDELLGVAQEFGIKMGEEGVVEGGNVNNVVTVWSHDITVQPGRSYRYRLKASLLNPLFKVAQVPAEQQKETFEKLTLWSAESEWSSHITIEPENHLFMVGADSGRKSANIEVYGIFNGRRVYRAFESQPGDSIGAKVTMVDGGFQSHVNLQVDAVVVDIDFDAPSGDRNLKPTTQKMIYLDQLSGSLFERTTIDDAANGFRKILKGEADKARPAAARLE